MVDNLGVRSTCHSHPVGADVGVGVFPQWVVRVSVDLSQRRHFVVGERIIEFDRFEVENQKVATSVDRDSKEKQK